MLITPKYIVNKALPSKANIESNRKNIHTINYYAQEVLGLIKLYMVDWFLEKGEPIKLENIEILFGIPENLLKIRLDYLKRKGFVIYINTMRSIINRKNFTFLQAILGHELR